MLTGEKARAIFKLLKAGIKNELTKEEALLLRKYYPFLGK